jgi:broad specificity phosphatase PhoE
MRKAALYVHGRIVVGDSHLEAFQKLTVAEQGERIVSGAFDTDTAEFDSDLAIDHFYDKDLLLIRHAHVQDNSEPDTPISEDGADQVKKLANTLKSFDLKDFVGLVSPFLRTLQSALILHEALNLDFRIEGEVMEIPMFLEDGQQYRLQNHQDKFPQFNWPSPDDWILTKESQRDFTDRAKLALQNFPRKCIVVTHYGFICNIARYALCDQKAEIAVTGAVPPASLTHIYKQEIKCLGREVHAEDTED